MKTILCFGDSNTWGYNPVDGTRYPEHQLWPGVMREELGSDFRVVEEGLNGRTTCWNDPVEPVDRNGRHGLPVCLESHRPVDLVIIMLGTNDLKVRFSTVPGDIAQGAALLLDIVRGSASGPSGSAPPVLLVSPPHIGDEPAFDGTFGQAREKSKKLSFFYRREADARDGCFFFDAAESVESSPVDGVHLSAESHVILGKALAREVLSLAV